MKQILQQKDEFVLFDEPYTIHKKIPYHTSMQKQDKHFPSDSILEKGSKAVRAYWNNKNLNKRVIK